MFFSDFQNIENSVFIFLDFQRLMSSFLWNCFSVAQLLTVCIYTLLFCCVCLEMGITLWESHGNGTRLKLGNANGKEWECKNPFPVISRVNPQHRDCRCNHSKPSHGGCDIAVHWRWVPDQRTSSWCVVRQHWRHRCKNVGEKNLKTLKMLETWEKENKTFNTR